MSEIKIAERFQDVTIHNLPSEIVRNPYLQKFASKLMDLSNRLNEVDSEYEDDADIKDNYLPAIREFIANITGL